MTDKEVEQIRNLLGEQARERRTKTGLIIITNSCKKLGLTQKQTEKILASMDYGYISNNEYRSFI